MAAQQAHLQVQSEQFRNYVLSSVSHDLRTPLAMIAVTASNLLEDSTEGTWDKKRAMLQTVVDESHRLSRQMENLLRHARLTSGNLVLNREWQVLEELVGIALTRLHDELGDRNIRVNIDRDFPLLWVAGDLIEQVLINLLENAIRYTPVGSEIEIAATQYDGQVELRVADRGPGLPADDRCESVRKVLSRNSNRRRPTRHRTRLGNLQSHRGSARRANSGGKSTGRRRRIHCHIALSAAKPASYA